MFSYLSQDIITSYARYRQINYYLNHYNDNNNNNNQQQQQQEIEKESDVQSKLNLYNIISCVLLFFSMFGIIIVGNFRSTEILPLHTLGVLIAFNCIIT